MEDIIRRTKSLREQALNKTGGALFLFVKTYYFAWILPRAFSS